VFLLRKCEWSRQLMAEVAALATPSIRRQIGNKGRIAEQGALTWVLHSQASKWKDRTLLERNFTMNGNWMDYAGKWQKGQRRLTQPVWGQDQIPFVVQYAGCQMCRGHSENGSWHDQGVRKCQSAFLEAYTFGDDQALHPLGLRHLTMDTHLVRSLPSSELYQRHMRMTRCLPRFLVIGTQKGGTSSFHFLLKSGWHDDVQACTSGQTT
jgi:xyloglucan 6-xylosyltransferase